MPICGTSRTRSLILDSRLFDDATIIDSSGPLTGFPATNMQDPQIGSTYRVSEGNGSAFFIVDFGANFSHAITAVAALFVNAVVRSLPSTDFTWRVQSGSTTSGTGATDTGTVAFWTPNPLPFPTGNYQDPQFYFLRGLGAHAILPLEDPISVRYMRVDFTWTGVPQSFVQFSRFFASQAIEPRVPYGTGIPSPVGAPPKQRVQWTTELTREQWGQLYGIAADSGTEPRIFTSWGHERFLLDGARTVVAVNDTNGEDRWRQQQFTTYGYISQLGDPTILSLDRVSVPITFDSL